MEELNKEEEKAVLILKNETHLSISLESEVLKQLKKKRLINSKPLIMKNNIFKIAASVLILVGVFYVGRITSQTDNESHSDNLYALFLYENDEFHAENPKKLVAEYRNWAIDLNKKELLAYAEKLDDVNRNWIGSKTLKNQESKLTGYFVYSATSYEEAKQIAQSHPHTSYGGAVELIQIDKGNIEN